MNFLGSAEGAKQDSPGRKPWVRVSSHLRPEGAKQVVPTRAFSDLYRLQGYLRFASTQGLGRCAALPWAVLFRAFGAPVQHFWPLAIQLLQATRDPFRRDGKNENGTWKDTD